jgi:hypothetical protein
LKVESGKSRVESEKWKVESVKKLFGFKNLSKSL